MSGKDKTLILGASVHSFRYSNMAQKALLRNDHSTIMVGKKADELNGQEILNHWPDDTQDIHTVTLYLNPRNQEKYYQKILDTKPERVIFNPGTENPELMRKLDESNISYLQACTLVMLSNGLY